MKGAECAKAVASAIKAGYRHIDTAPIYDNEDGVGEGVLPRSHDLFLTTRFGPRPLGATAFRRAEPADRVDYVDLILIHWPSKSLPVAETIKPLNAVKRQGLARHIGVSNFTAALLEEAWAATREPLVANQCEYHPFLSQEKVLAVCRKHGMAFVSYTPLGRSALLDQPVVQEIAGRLGRSPAQIVLRWHIQQPGVAAIPKSATSAHLAGNIDIFDFTLDAEDMAALSGLARPEGRQVDFEFSPRWDR
jgi:diketogulonate reductase-like aldo/keto reductase